MLVIMTTGKEFLIFLVFLTHNQSEANDIYSLFSCPLILSANKYFTCMIKFYFPQQCYKKGTIHSFIN